MKATGIFAWAHGYVLGTHDDTICVYDRNSKLVTKQHPVTPEPVSLLIPPTLPQPAVQAPPVAVPLVKEVWRAEQ